MSLVVNGKASCIRQSNITSNGPMRVSTYAVGLIILV